jgi:hypothetical protein
VRALYLFTESDEAAQASANLAGVGELIPSVCGSRLFGRASQQSETAGCQCVQ